MEEDACDLYLSDDGSGSMKREKVTYVMSQNTKEVICEHRNPNVSSVLPQSILVVAPTRWPINQTTLFQLLVLSQMLRFG